MINWELQGQIWPSATPIVIRREGKKKAPTYPCPVLWHLLPPFPFSRFHLSFGTKASNADSKDAPQLTTDSTGCLRGGDGEVRGSQPVGRRDPQVGRESRGQKYTVRSRGNPSMVSGTKYCEGWESGSQCKLKKSWEPLSLKENFHLQHTSRRERASDADSAVSPTGQTDTMIRAVAVLYSVPTVQYKYNMKYISYFTITFCSNFTFFSHMCELIKYGTVIHKKNWSWHAITVKSLDCNRFAIYYSYVHRSKALRV